MAGDDLHVRWQYCSHLLTGCDHALHAAARGDVNEGKSVADIVVAHVHYIGLGEEDDGVTVGVSCGKVQCPDVLSVEVHSDVMVEGNDGQCALLGWLCVHGYGTAVAGFSASFQALANVVLSDDRSAFGGERHIPASVIAVIMGIDDEADGLVGDADALQSGGNLVSQRSVLVIHDNDAIIADGRRDVSAGALQHVNVAGDFCDLDLYFVEVLVLRRDQQCSAHEEKEFQQQNSLCHISLNSRVVLSQRFGLKSECARQYSKATRPS